MRYTPLICILMLSCTTVDYKQVAAANVAPDSYIDSSFYPILKVFEYEANIRGHRLDESHLVMKFGLMKRDSNDTAVGRCSTSDKGAVISIQRKAWRDMSRSQQEEAIFHELGHCLIGRDHCDVVSVNGKPVSLMYSHLMETRYYESNREDLIDELFNIDSECVHDNGNSHAINGKFRSQAN